MNTIEQETIAATNATIQNHGASATLSSRTTGIGTTVLGQENTRNHPQSNSLKEPEHMNTEFQSPIKYGLRPRNKKQVNYSDVHNFRLQFAQKTAVKPAISPSDKDEGEDFEDTVEPLERFNWDLGSVLSPGSDDTVEIPDQHRTEYSYESDDEMALLNHLHN